MPYEYDEDRIIALSDIFQKTDAEIEEGLVANLISTPFQWSGESTNILVNGQGQLPGSEPGPGCEVATIGVEPDKTYRFRFIGGTALSFVSLAFEDHEIMTLFEADGDYTKPVNITYLQIGSGQRFSVLFRTKSRNDLLKKSQFFMQMETRDRPTLTRSFAILKYKLPRSSKKSTSRAPSDTTNRSSTTLRTTTNDAGMARLQTTITLPRPEFSYKFGSDPSSHHPNAPNHRQRHRNVGPRRQSLDRNIPTRTLPRDALQERNHAIPLGRTGTCTPRHRSHHTCVPS